MSSSGNSHSPTAPDMERVEAFLREHGASKVKVHGLRVKGNARTKAHIVLREFHHLKSRGPTPLTDLLGELEQAKERLDALGVFRHVEAFVDTPTPSHGDKTACDVTVKVEEAPRASWPGAWKIGVDTDGRGKMETTASWQTRNIFGRAESFLASFAAKQDFGSVLNIDFRIPRGRNRFFHAQLIKEKENNLLKSSHHEKIRGFLCGWEGCTGEWDESLARTDLRVRVSRTHSSDGTEYPEPIVVEDTGRVNTKTTWSAGYRVDWREICNLPDQASITVWREMGPSVKSGLYTEIEHITRRETGLMSRLRLSAETAGLGGDVFHVKPMLHWTVLHPVVTAAHNVEVEGEGKALVEKYLVTAEMSLSTGALVPLWGDRTRISDRFFAGGVGRGGPFFRGFRTKGVGPHDGEDSLGGDAFWIAHALLRFPALRSLDRWGVKLHAFGTIGNIVAWAPTETWRSRGERLLSDIRASVGAGLAIPIPMIHGTLEVNGNYVIRRRPEDRPRLWQLGLAASFGYM